MRCFPVTFRRLALVALMALPAACTIAPPPPASPLLGAWTTSEHTQIAFRPDTVVIHPPGEQPTPMNAASCSGAFRFGYARKSREALLGLAPSQPDVRHRLARLLVQPEYPVAEVACGEGASTYVLLDERDLVVIHRDQDIAGIETLTRL